jgi:uncharacterized Tic20 family protein
MENAESLAPEIATDERIMAALAHGGVLLPMTGVIVPIVIWVTQKDKSRYVAFQSFQAMLYQLVLILMWFAGMACYMGSFFAMFGGALLSESYGQTALDNVFPFIPMGIFGMLMCGGLFFVVYGLVAAVMTLMGRDFRYLFVGRLAERIQNRRVTNVSEVKEMK